MKTVLHLVARFKKLKWDEIKPLSGLALIALLSGITAVLLDISTAGLLLEKQGILGFGINYILAALMGIPAAYAALVLDRKRGYGLSVALVALLFVWTGLIGLNKYVPASFDLNLLFAFKYGTLFLLNVALWLLAERFIKISFGSLKFTTLFGLELVGMFVGACVAQNRPAINVLDMGLIGLCGLALLFKIISLMAPVPRETFILKTGGVQDKAEHALMNMIFALSFCWTCVHLLIEFQVYDYLIQNKFNIVTVLAWLKMACAAGGLLVMICLARTRFIYTTPVGLILCAFSAAVCAMGSLFHENWMIVSGAVLFWITGHFYMTRYLSLLPRPLAFGKGVRIKKVRWLVMKPLAFILTGALLLNQSSETMDWILLVGTGILSLLFLISGYLYGRQLMKMCALRIWRGGPLMLAYPPLKQMVIQGASKKNAADAIYFLNVLKEGYTAEYRELLLYTLKHGAVSVRVFVLNQMLKLNLKPKEKKAVQVCLESDESEEVRNLALSVLINNALDENQARAWYKYKDFLDDKKWVQGACCGFLFGRGPWLNKVMEKVRKLAASKKEEENLKALYIMQMHPKKEWGDLVGVLLNMPQTEVVKKALGVAGKLAAPALLNRLLPMLDEMRWRDSVLETLSAYRKAAFPAIEKMILNEQTPMDRRKELILFLGRLPSGEGKQMLLRVLFTANRRLRAAVVESLSDSQIVWIENDRKNVLAKALKTAVSEWHEIHETLIQTGHLEEESFFTLKPLLENALETELNRTRQLVLAQVNLYVTEKIGQEALEVLKGDNFNAYAGAVSCLQDILPTKIYRQVRPVLLYPTWNEPPKEVRQMPVAVFLNRFILNPFVWTNEWMQALALYGWRELNEPVGLVAVEQGLKSSNWMVLEAALSALGRLEKNKEKVREMVLSVPTRYLLQQDFENLLEEKDVYHH